MVDMAVKAASQAGADGDPSDSEALEVGTSSLREYVGYLVRRAQLLIFQDVIGALEPYDLRPTQFSMLMILSARPGLRQADVADLLGVQRTNLVKMVDVLEARGLMVREKSQEDRRSHSLRLTEAGHVFLAEARGAVQHHENRIGEAIGEENRAELLRLLKLFNREFRPEERG